MEQQVHNDKHLLCVLLCVSINAENFIKFLLLKLTYQSKTASFPGQTGWAGTRQNKPIWFLMKQQITTPTPRHSIFTCWMLFPMHNQQRQSTEGKMFHKDKIFGWFVSSILFCVSTSFQFCNKISATVTMLNIVLYSNEDIDDWLVSGCILLQKLN